MRVQLAGQIRMGTYSSSPNEDSTKQKRICSILNFNFIFRDNLIALFRSKPFLEKIKGIYQMLLELLDSLPHL